MREKGQYRMRERKGKMEELYWESNVAILTLHDGEEAKIVKTFSRQTPIKDCLWCKFEVDSKLGTFRA